MCGLTSTREGFREIFICFLCKLSLKFLILKLIHCGDKSQLISQFHNFEVRFVLEQWSLIKYLFWKLENGKI